MNSKFLKRVALGCLVLGTVNYGNIGNTMEEENVINIANQDNNEFDPISLKEIGIPSVPENVLKESKYKNVGQINKLISHLNKRIDANYIGNDGRFAIAANVVKNIDAIFQFYDEEERKQNCETLVNEVIESNHLEGYNIDVNKVVNSVVSKFQDVGVIDFVESLVSCFVDGNVKDKETELKKLLNVYYQDGATQVMNLLQYSEIEDEESRLSFAYNYEETEDTFIKTASIVNFAGASSILKPKTLQDSDIMRYCYTFGGTKDRENILSQLQEVDDIPEDIEKFVEIDQKMVDFITSGNHNNMTTLLEVIKNPTLIVGNVLSDEIKEIEQKEEEGAVQFIDEENNVDDTIVMANKNKKDKINKGDIDKFKKNQDVLLALGNKLDKKDNKIIKKKKKIVKEEEPAKEKNKIKVEKEEEPAKEENNINVEKEEKPAKKENNINVEKEEKPAKKENNINVEKEE